MSRAFLITVFCILSLCSAGQTEKGSMSASERLNSFEKFSQMKKASPYRDLHWQYAGPANISGRCTDVEAVSPRGRQYTIWIGSASGGVWKSVNEGTTFTPVFDEMASASIGDIAIDPVNPDIVWVGTGEANIFRSSNAGCGVYKTEDGGETWVHLGLENTHTIARIRINPENTDVVYVAATGHEWTPNEDRGLYRTTDGGKTWEKILYIDSYTGVADVVIDPANPETIYATTWERIRLKWNDPRNNELTQNSGVWKSTDGGSTWRQINTGLPLPQHRGRTGIDISKTNPDVLYLLLDNYEVAYKAGEGEKDAYGRQKKDVIRGATVYRTGDAGESWEQVSGKTAEMKTFMEHHSATYGWVFGQIRVDPSDENTVYTLGIELNRSVDGGKSFSALDGPHVDHHGLWIDPLNHDYLLNVQDGGLTISYDGGKTWKYPIEPLPLAQFYNIEYDFSVPFRVFGSVQDHHSYYGPVDISRGRDRIRPVSFTGTLGAEGSSHAIDPRDNNTLFASMFYGLLARASVDRYPHDRKYLIERSYADELGLRGEWVAPTILSPHNPDVVYHGMQYVMRSGDRGESWKIISPDLSFNDPVKQGDINYQTIQTIDESPLVGGLLYAGTDDGRIWRTRNGGKSWTEIGRGTVPQIWVSRILASKYDPATVYMTQTGRRDDDFQIYVWRSTDYGDTWEDISGNIPFGPANVIREDPLRQGILYLGTDAAVFITSDGGKKWDILGDLPFTYVHDLKIHPRDNMIIIATHGRGIFVLDANPVNR